MKCLASLEEINSVEYKGVMDEINKVGKKGNLRLYTTYSRIWEYPFCWFNIKKYYPRGAKILDIGSEMSPFPFFLAMKGYDVTIMDAHKKWKEYWRKASRELGVSIKTKIAVSERLPFPDRSFDIYLSVSVIEHTFFKKEALEEAARVLKPGGLLILTFDIYEKDLGMIYPKEFGVPLNMAKFDEIFAELPCFSPLEKDTHWNVEAIPDFLKWHKSTKPIHSYVIGGAVFRRNHVKVTPRTSAKVIILVLKIFDRYYMRPPIVNITMRLLDKFHRLLKVRRT